MNLGPPNPTSSLIEVRLCANAERLSKIILYEKLTNLVQANFSRENVQGVN